MYEQIQDVVNSVSQLVSNPYVLSGAALMGLAFLHRGPFNYDSERGVHVSTGTGISQLIQRRMPAYARISTLVDHIIWDAGMTLGAYGVFSLSGNPNAAFNAGWITASAHVLLEGIYAADRKLSGCTVNMRDQLPQLAVDVITSLSVARLLQ